MTQWYFHAPGQADRVGPFDVRWVQGIRSMLFGGEDVFLATLTRPQGRQEPRQMLAAGLTGRSTDVWRCRPLAGNRWDAWVAGVAGQRPALHSERQAIS
ncbi:hypothetical protein LMF57_00265 [Stenotrophomonas sp. SI-NJAU-1]|uniref:hypothetical protein n=1 Tax=Stenotrophomonas sp. SI-NJAU-1 TaxID=2886359 RepID=UPI001E623522|nr:hypothetical protein [Stenotrophomonas sp. SI-NJAU-1]UEX18328.1 hypothetical protein LMF57_00265 [Stenotrophomonas sp. SI-NJAU-1]